VGGRGLIRLKRSGRHRLILGTNWLTASSGFIDTHPAVLFPNNVKPVRFHKSLPNTEVGSALCSEASPSKVPHRQAGGTSNFRATEQHLCSSMTSQMMLLSIGVKRAPLAQPDRALNKSLHFGFTAVEGTQQPPPSASYTIVVVGLQHGPSPLGSAITLVVCRNSYSHTQLATVRPSTSKLR